MFSGYLLGVIVLLFLVTGVTRSLPFLFGQWIVKNKMLLLIGEKIPAAIIFLLLIYYIMLVAKPMHYHNLVYELIALVITLLVQWKWRLTILSLVIGVACFALLQNLRF